MIEPPPRGQCFNWEQTGECKFGNGCRFLHGADDDGSRFVKKEKKTRNRHRVRDLNDIGEDDGEEREERKPRVRKPRVRKPRERQPREKIDEVCNNYSAGHCPYGDDCRRQHIGTIEQKIEKIDEICNNFQRGQCRFGDNCRRIHE